MSLPAATNFAASPTVNSWALTPGLYFAKISCAGCGPSGALVGGAAALDGVEPEGNFQRGEFWVDCLLPVVESA